jgi:hypothetical protein
LLLFGAPVVVDGEQQGVAGGGGGAQVERGLAAPAPDLYQRRPGYGLGRSHGRPVQGQALVGGQEALGRFGLSPQVGVQGLDLPGLLRG